MGSRQKQYNKGQSQSPDVSLVLWRPTLNSCAPVRLLLSQYQHRAITEASRHSAAAAAPRMIPASWPVLRPGTTGVGGCVVGGCVVGGCVVGGCVVGGCVVGGCVVGGCVVGGVAVSG